MGKNKSCDESTREVIIKLRDKNWSYKKIADHLQCSKTMIFHAVKHFNTYQTTSNIPRVPKQRNSSRRDDRNIVRLAKQYPLKGSNELRKEYFGENNSSAISARTIRRRLVEAKLNGRIARKNELSMRAKQNAQNDIQVFCPKCNSEVSHTAEGIQLDQTKIIVAKVYHYFEQEYEELKKTIEGIEQTPLSMFRQRTALATGVSETTVEEILQEEERRNEDMRQQTLPRQSLARKRPRQTDSSTEDGSSDENIADDDDQTETLVIKEEPLEPYNEEPEIFVELPNVKVEPGVSGDNQELTDPISVDLKTEPLNQEATTSNETTAVQRASNSSKKRKTKRNTGAPSDASTSSAIAAPFASFAPPATAAPPGTSTQPVIYGPPERRLILLEDGEVKMEQIEIGEEGFS